jgi:hypothetical protein
MLLFLFSYYAFLYANPFLNGKSAGRARSFYVLGNTGLYHVVGSTMLWVTPRSLIVPGLEGVTSQNHGHLVHGVLLGAHSLWPTGACQLFKNTPPPIAEERFCWIRYPLVTLKTILLVLYVLLSILADCKQ